MSVNFINLRSKLYPYFTRANILEYEHYYCPLIETYDWKKGTLRIGAKNGTDFEKKVSDFISSDNDLINDDNVRVIIGGIGTGKSTTINYIFNKIINTKTIDLNLSLNDTDEKIKPIFLNLNFEDEDEEDIDKPFENYMIDQFWTTVSSKIQDLNTINFNKDEKEFIKYLKWCYTQQRFLANSLLFHKYLQTEKSKIDAYLNNIEIFGLNSNQIEISIHDSFSTLSREMSAEDFCWHMVFMLKYELSLQSTKNFNNRYVLLDNVDHLHPEVQRTGVSFAINLSEILNAKTIITIRPLTWERSSHAHNLVDILYQFSPSISTVIKKRINWFLSRETITKEEKKALKSLTDIMTGNLSHYHPLSNMLVSTSGIGVRFALRNFINMLESPILSNESFESIDYTSMESIKVWKLARAYLFGTRDHLIPHAFENLYSVDKKRNNILLKPRILDYIERFSSGETELLRVVNFIQSFGYDLHDINIALNELLDRQRPLLWSNVSYRINIQDQSSMINSKIITTPIGKGYINNLFGEYSYDEQCLAKSADEFVTISEVDQLHKLIIEEDFKDIRNYCSKNSSFLYKKIYPQDVYSLSYLHWKNLKVGIARISQYTMNYNFDANRLQWIQTEIDKILNDPL